MKTPVTVSATRGGKWQVRSTGKRAHRIVATQAEAIQIGRRIAMNRRCELTVKRVDDSIRSKDAFGIDPFPPRD